MHRRIDRREFLKTGSLAAGALAIQQTRAKPDVAPAPKPADVRIAATPYQPVADYPIQPTRHSEVVLNDDFWAPKIALNADVTIPFEVQKLSEGGRGLGGQNMIDSQGEAVEDGRPEERREGFKHGRDCRRPPCFNGGPLKRGWESTLRVWENRHSTRPGTHDPHPAHRRHRIHRLPRLAGPAGSRA